MRTKHVGLMRTQMSSLDLAFCIAYFSVSHFSRILELAGVNRMISYGAYVLLFAYYFIRRIRCLTWDTIVFYIVVLPAVVYGVYKNHTFIQSQTNVYAILLLFIPSYYFFRLIDKKIVPKALRISSYFSLAYLVPYYIFVVRNTNYSMDYGYWVAVPICVLWYYILTEKKIYDMLLLVVGALTLLIGGSRASLALTLACCFVMYFIKYPSRKRLARVVLFLFSTFALVVLALMNRHLSSDASSVTGIGSRNIEKILSGDFFSLSTRMPLYKQAWDLIMAKPLGYGVLTSRSLITKWPYPHSIFLELQLDLGLIPGMLLFFFIVALAIWLCWRYRSSGLLVLTTMLLIIDLGRLFVSYSVYYMDSVPAIFALAASTISDNRFFGRVKNNDASV